MELGGGGEYWDACLGLRPLRRRKRGAEVTVVGGGGGGPHVGRSCGRRLLLLGGTLELRRRSSEPLGQQPQRVSDGRPAGGRGVRGTLGLQRARGGGRRCRRH